MRHFVSRIPLFLAALCVSAVVQAGDATVQKRYPLPERGYLQMRIPAAWDEAVEQPGEALPPTIAFRARRGKQFAVLVTPIWRVRADVPPQTSDSMRNMVERAASEASTQAVEKTIQVVEFSGASGPGFYFSATDRAPKPDEYKFMTQGMVKVSDLLVTFTILTNEGQLQVAKDALAALKSAVHISAR